MSEIPVSGKLILRKKVYKEFLIYTVYLDLNGVVSIPMLTVSYDTEAKVLQDTAPISCFEMKLNEFKEPMTIAEVVSYAEELLKKGGEGALTCSRMKREENIKIVKTLLTHSSL